MRYTFEWDPAKARQNLRKHRIGFDRAAEIFLDPLAVSIVDELHSEEERWITMGRDGRGGVLVLIHTFREASGEECRIRIISVRAATKKELKRYEELQP